MCVLHLQTDPKVPRQIGSLMTQMGLQKESPWHHQRMMERCDVGTGIATFRQTATHAQDSFLIKFTASCRPFCACCAVQTVTDHRRSRHQQHGEGHLE